MIKRILKILTPHASLTILYFVVAIVVNTGCSKRYYSKIKNKEFISTRTSPQFVGRNKLELSQKDFTFHNDERLLENYHAQTFTEYSGRYKLEGNKLILNTQSVKFCKKIIDGHVKAIGETGKPPVRGSFIYLECPVYQNYEVEYLDSIGYKHYNFFMDTLIVNESKSRVTLNFRNKRFVKAK